MGRRDEQLGQGDVERGRMDEHLGHFFRGEREVELLEEEAEVDWGRQGRRGGRVADDRRVGLRSWMRDILIR